MRVPSLLRKNVYIRPGFEWNAADAYLFDIDGTLLNSRDPVHYFAFQNALKSIFGIEAKIDGIPVHGNTDTGILRAVLRRAGIADAQINVRLPQMIAQMCAEVERNREQMCPELCASMYELVSGLHAQGKLLGAAYGNLEPIGWLKIEKAGLRKLFSFGVFAYPLEFRRDIFMHGINIVRQRLGKQAQVYVVGDTPSDIEAAKAVDVPIIAVATGIYKFDELQVLQPDACFPCATDMLNYRGEC